MSCFMTVWSGSGGWTAWAEEEGPGRLASGHGGQRGRRAVSTARTGQRLLRTNTSWRGVLSEGHHSDLSAEVFASLCHPAQGWEDPLWSSDTDSWGPGFGYPVLSGGRSPKCLACPEVSSSPTREQGWGSGERHGERVGPGEPGASRAAGMMQRPGPLAGALVRDTLCSSVGLGSNASPAAPPPPPLPLWALRLTRGHGSSHEHPEGCRRGRWPCRVLQGLPPLCTTALEAPSGNGVWYMGTLIMTQVPCQSLPLTV